MSNGGVNGVTSTLKLRPVLERPGKFSGSLALPERVFVKFSEVW